MTKAEKMELLYAALHDDDADEFKRLLALYPDCRLNDSGDDGWMDAAAMDGKPWAIEYLVAEGADVNKPSNSTDSTPLPEGPIQWAAAGGHLDTVRVMLDLGARVNTVLSGQRRCVPLWFAVADGHLEVVRLLAERGADVNASRNDATALDDAIFYDRDEVAAYLRSVGGKTAAELT